MGSEVRLQLFEEAADEERLASLTQSLREELLQLDVDDVRLVQTGSLPAGARSVDAAAVGGLVILVGQSAQALRSVVSAIRRWLSGRDQTTRSVRLEINGASLELSNASEADQERLVRLILDRHDNPGGQ
jgi:preprotein translocase subunit SecD